MVLKLYGTPLSQPSRAVLLFAKLTGIEHEYVPVDMSKLMHKQPWYLAINPMGQVPAMSDGDFNLSESHAIMTYLATTRHTPDHWYPADPQKRALVDRYLHWHHSNLRRAAIPVYAQTIDPLLGRTKPEAIIADGIEARTRSFVQLEDWLSQSPYIAGTEMTIADLAAVCEVAMQSLVDFDLTPYPHVQAWASRIFQIPEVVEVHQGMEGFKAMLNAKKREQAEKARAE